MANARTAAVTAGSKGTVDSAGAELERVDRELRAFVKERPVLALLSAIAAGYIVGRGMRRVG